MLEWALNQGSDNRTASSKVDFNIGGETQAGKEVLLGEGIRAKDLNFSTENGPWNKPPEFSLDLS